MSGGTIGIQWSGSDSATVDILTEAGVSSTAFTVAGSAVTFPYVLTQGTRFATAIDGRFTVSVKQGGREIANTPDGTRVILLENGAQFVFAPSADTDAGSVSRSSLVFNVKDYGAVGDGVTSDSPAVNAAITAASGSANPAVVYFPYTANGYGVGGITLAAGVTLRGERQVKLKRVGTTAAIFLNIAGSDARIENLTIDGNGLATTDVIQIASSSVRVTITDCKITDSGGLANVSGIETRDLVTDVLIERCVFDGVDTPVFVNKGPARCTVRNNRITNWKTRAIYVLGDATYACTDLAIERNHISGNINTSGTRQPIAIVGNDANLHQRVRVNYNTVIGNNKSFTASGDPGTADQISLHRCVDFEVIGNISRDGGDMGITIAQQCARGVVSNNTCTNNDVGSIAFGSSTSTSVKTIVATGNLSMNNGQNRNSDRAVQNRTGFYVYNATDISISGNTFGDDQGSPTQQYGVSMFSSTGVKMVGNVWSGLVIGRMYNGGSNTGIEFGPAYPPVFKTADQTVNNSVTRVSDTHLTAAVEASAVYLVETYLIYNSSTVADINIAWAVPSGATIKWVSDGLSSAAANAVSSLDRTALTAGSNRVMGGVAADAVAMPVGVLTVSATAGSLTLQWAQNTQEATDTKMLTGSWIRLTRIA